MDQDTLQYETKMQRDYSECHFRCSRYVICGEKTISEMAGKHGGFISSLLHFQKKTGFIIVRDRDFLKLGDYIAPELSHQITSVAGKLIVYYGMDSNFANAREIRNILDQVIMCQNMRTVGTDDNHLGIVDVNKYINDVKINLPTAAGNTTNKLLTGRKSLINLSVLKP